jgi:hypothetical protein
MLLLDSLTLPVMQRLRHQFKIRTDTIDDLKILCDDSCIASLCRSERKQILPILLSENLVEG